MSHMLVLFCSIGFAIIPPILYALLIWWLDWYERESPLAVLFSFLWGAVVAAGVGAFSEFVLHIPLRVLFNPAAADFILTTIAAPAIEEFAKGALLLIILHETEFDNLTDGIVHGAIIGLGFSLSENVAYFYGAYEEGGTLAWLGNILFRSAFCCALHATATAITGAAIGLAKFHRRPARVAFITIGFAGATGVHMGWNGFLSLGELLHAALLTAISLIALPLVVLFVAGLFAWSLAGERAIIRRELAEETAGGWLPPAHVAILASLAKRHAHGWLPSGVDQSAYVRTLTELAFRRHQLRAVSPRKRPNYEQMVEALRRHAQALLLQSG